MRILLALIKKESLQIIRDPSSILIAFILPLILLFIYGYGVNLDSNRVSVGLVLEDTTPEIVSLSTALSNSRFLDVRTGLDRRQMEKNLTAGTLRGVIVIPQNFAAKTSGSKEPRVQVIADGTEPNTASFVQNYARGAVETWLTHRTEDTGAPLFLSPIQVESRFWYNPELKSRHFLIPGSIAIIMTLIGTLLTALVVAREWERGTMEALMATPVSILQILLGKLIPYFALGLGSMVLCWSVAVFWYDVPFRGSFLVLAAISSVFLLASLGQGLLISSVTKDQFLAAQTALITAFLPAFMLSGFIFEISSMPLPIRALTQIFAARYFVSSLQTLFLAGNIWPLLASCTLAMGIIAVILFAATMKKNVKRLDA